MALSFGPMNIGNPEGLWALIALVPLIILYLIRPKPRPMAIPSLMFFLKSSGSRKLTSFLKQITHDWLFLIQLLLLLALTLTFALPFHTYEFDVTASNTVIVMDVSASMQATTESKSRFDLGINQAKKVLGSKNSVVLAKDIPYLALQDATASETTSFLNALKPKSTISHIGEAIILAGETLGTEGRVVVISDFVNTGGQDPEIAKAVLESKGITVDFVSIGSPGENFGIVDLDAGNEQTTVYVKNYNAEGYAVPLHIGATKTSLDIPGNNIESFSFKTPPGTTKIEITARDDLAVDNVAYLSAPEAGKAKVLLIANNASVFLRNALLASGELEVTTSVPPVIQDGDFEVIIVNNVDRVQLLPGTFEDLLEKAEEGATVIVTVQPDSFSLEYQGLLPLKLGENVDGGFIMVEQLNRFTKNVEFGSVTTVSNAELIGDQTVIATANDVPVITIKSVGAGKVIYYGIPGDSEFRYSPSYPIFWTELMKFVTEQQDVRNLNFKVGETIILNEEQKIKTPSRVVERAALVLDESGVYELEDRHIAVNLIDELESNLNLDVSKGTRSSEYELRPVKEEREFHWTIWLLVFALFMVLFEVFFTKYRGDL